MREEMNEDMLCPLRYVLDIIGGKWKLPILCILIDGEPKRYSEIKKKIPDITNMMLSQSLKELELHGIVSRRQYNEVPPRVEYTLNEGMDDLMESLRMLGQWGASHMQETGEGRARCQRCQEK